LDKTPVIEDNSHLKSELAEIKQLYTASLQQLGQLQNSLDISYSALEVKSSQYNELAQKFDKLQHQKKSSEVKTGFLAEALLPLTEQFPCNPKTMRFLGSPIDFVSFDYDKMEICFVECKTGDSQLNDNQRKVKKMVEEGRVKFAEVRLNEKGIKVK
jgi:predicted Holliday junction resolvase-like endonuclease